MSDQIDNGGHSPAMPVTAGNQVYATGMSLRDWFAGQALAGMLPNDVAAAADKEALAEQAYCYADAMLIARKGGAA